MNSRTQSNALQLPTARRGRGDLLLSALISGSLFAIAAPSSAACMYRDQGGAPRVWLYVPASEIQSYTALGYETRDCAQRTTSRAKFIERICGEAAKPNVTSDAGSAVFGVPYSKACASAQAAPDN